MKTKKYINSSNQIMENNNKSEYISLCCDNLNMENHNTLKTEIKRLETKNNQLRLENRAHKSINKEYESAVEIADQVAHDIRSPIACMLMVIPQCELLPDDVRDVLIQSITRVNKIANELLNRFKHGASTEHSVVPFLVSPIATEILAILTEKKHEYSKLPIKFTYNFGGGSDSIFVRMDTVAFGRSLSNIINNAVDALDGNDGIISLNLNASDKTVKVIIQDNGRGMPPTIVNKILSGVKVTADKKDGHGIGLRQVGEMLRLNNGTMSIKSSIGRGTKITLSFLRVNA
jgi:signal transduction histidine kinase